MAKTDFYDDPAAPPPNSIVPAATALVRNDRGEVLMIHRTDNDLWALPGGGQDFGESLPDAVVREVKEETGIDVEVINIVGTYSDPRHVIAYDDGEVRQEFSICFEARPVGGELRESSESKEVRWVPADDVGLLNINQSMRLRIKHGLEPSRSRPYLG